MGKVSCELCGLSCTSVRSLCEHVVGVKHKALLARFAPAKLRELGRVQYFLDTYLKEEPILGLEYVVERQVGSSYLYTCLLCNAECEWRNMVAHVTDVDHAESYIYKHHSDMTGASSHLTREEQVRALDEAAQAIYAKFGRKEIRLHKTDDECTTGPSSKEGGENNGATPVSTGDNGTTIASRRESDAPDPQNYDCGLCDVKCASPVALCEHLQGNKHKRNLQRTAPEQLRELGRLGYFLHTHLKEDPIIGLEYVVETGPGPSYKYSCQLCGLETDLLKIVVHIADVDHMDRYVKKHHGDLLPSVPKFTKKVVYLKTLRDVAVKIVEKHGRKDIRLQNTAGPAKAEAFPRGEGRVSKPFEESDDLPYGHDRENSSHSKKRPLSYYEMEWDETYEGYGYHKMFKKF